MKTYWILIFTLFGLLACNEEKEISSISSENWSKKSAQISEQDSLEYGKSYLSVYSQIYSLSEHKTHNLTSMASLRNTSDVDTIFILKASYFDTHGHLVRTYIDQPIYMAPMETTEIVIAEIDISGGTGSNFIFEWKIPKDCPEPLFEGVMTSTRGQQGLSFMTQAKRIK